MNLDEIKATLAMENLYLTPAEEELLQDFANGDITFEELKNIFLKISQHNPKAA